MLTVMKKFVDLLGMGLWELVLKPLATVFGVLFLAALFLGVIEGTWLQ